MTATIAAINSNGRVGTLRKLDVGAGAKSDDGWETMDVSPAYHPDFFLWLLACPVQLHCPLPLLRL